MISFYMIQNRKKHLIKLLDPYIFKEEAKATTKVIQSKFWASGSETYNIKKFEYSFLKYTKSKKCIAINDLYDC